MGIHFHGNDLDVYTVFSGHCFEVSVAGPERFLLDLSYLESLFLSSTFIPTVQDEFRLSDLHMC